MAKERLEIGLIEIYTGDCKGKSTAAFGLAVRGAGQGFQVRIVQFMKCGGYGENMTFDKLYPDIQVFSYGRKCFLLPEKEAKQQDLDLAAAAMAKAAELIGDGNTDILILDEINNALFFHLVTLEEVEALLDKKPPHMEVVLTGRNAPQTLIERADLVTEMREIKHPFTASGMKSRKGIEY